MVYAEESFTSYQLENISCFQSQIQFYRKKEKVSFALKFIDLAVDQLSVWKMKWNCLV